MSPQVSTYHPPENGAENGYLTLDYPSARARDLQDRQQHALTETDRKVGARAANQARSANAKAAADDEKRRRDLIGERQKMLRGSPFWNERAVEDARRQLAEQAGITLPYSTTPLDPKVMTEWLKRLKVNTHDYEAWCGGSVGTFCHYNPDWSLRDWLALVLEYRDYISTFAPQART
ncbi:MAG: hypothetical protein M1401_03455 [Chloroflexi bacterium]|nr:hypothetical protein [Chloroflexota bacterium]MCL5107923.1 hypothetical protein [Chloroflexota bacterium]